MKKKRKFAKSAVLAVSLVIVFLLWNWLFNTRGKTDISIDKTIDNLAVSSRAFSHNHAIPDKYTGKGEDVSPDFQFENLSSQGVSIAIIMDDLDVPWRKNFNHWTIWNIPAQNSLPEAIPHGSTVTSLDGAVQGVGYGVNRYRGPNPPFGSHRYIFHVFVLDKMLDLEASSGKEELLDAFEDHIIQYGNIIGWYPKAR